jgi:hypothetical protein
MAWSWRLGYVPSLIVEATLIVRFGGRLTAQVVPGDLCGWAGLNVSIGGV